MVDKIERKLKEDLHMMKAVQTTYVKNVKIAEELLSIYQKQNGR